MRLSNRRPLILGAGFLLFGIGVVLVLTRKPSVAQPIAFNHKLHAGDLKIECAHCHQAVESGPFATLPKAEVCLECHSSPMSENPEEAKVREYGGESGEIPWERLTRLPTDVYFSHQRHVTFGKIPCERCHGRMEERTKPPSRAPMELSMDDCLDCHRKQGAPEDCVLCHR